jgi:dimethylhistidine N-methyltransferase
MNTLFRTPRADQAFLADVLAGLSRPRKQLPCKYFYDERGSRLFDAICELPEYYPTRSELAILERHAGEMAAALGPRCGLVEYGSGSGLKTRLLLGRLGEGVYYPVDISREHLLASARRLAEEFPAVEVVPVCADFTRPFQLPEARREVGRRVVYFSGSTIGNFPPRQARALLRRISRLVGPGGGLLIGVDLKKDPAVLEPAYDDAAGVTAAFNLNLLVRANRELGADFDLGGFRHLAFYNERHGRVEMHLVSEREQAVRVGGHRFRFAEGETIRTEYSYKFDLEGFAGLARSAWLCVRRVWRDPAGLFSVQYAEASGSA